MNYEKQIIDKLDALGVYDTSGPFSIHRHIRDSSKYVEELLKGLPNENKQRILDEQFEGNCSIDAWWQDVKRKGFLSFEPYFIQDDSVLALKSNRFLHFYNNREFRVSYTIDGDGVYHSSVGDLKLVGDLFGVRPDRECNYKLLQYFYYMTAIMAASGLEVFDNVITNNTGLFDTFMQSVINQKLGETTITMEDVLGLITPIEDVSLRGNSYKEVYRIAKSETTDYMRIYYRNSLYMVAELLVNGRPRFYALDLTKIFAKDKDLLKQNGYTPQEFIKIVSELETIKSITISFLACALGMNINYNVVHPKKNKEWYTMPALNYKGVNMLRNLTDLK